MEVQIKHNIKPQLRFNRHTKSREPRKSESNETKITTMDHSTNQPNILKLQLQQINNQITQLRLHLTTLTQLDNDSDEVITSIENVEDNINTLTQQKSI